MRKLLVLALLLPFFIAACKNKSSERSITGKWKPYEMNIADMSEERKKDVINNLSLEFSADGKFVMNNESDHETGTYKLDQKTNKLTIINDRESEQRTQEFTVGWQDENLTLTNEDGTVKLKKQ